MKTARPAARTGLALLIAAMCVALLVPAIASASAASASHALTWTSTGGPYGGVVQDIAVDPSDPATLYASTAAEDYSAGGLYKTGNGGVSWSEILPTGTGPVAINPVHPSKVFVGSGDTVMKTADGGKTWSDAGDGLPGDRPVQRLVLDPGDTATVFAIVLYQGMYETADGGHTWTNANATLPDPVTALAFDPASPSVAYAGLSSGAVYKSTDGGATWTPAGAGPWVGGSVDAIAIDPASASTVFLGLDFPNGPDGRLLAYVYVSDDGGETWNERDITANAPGPISNIAVDPGAPSTVYVDLDGQSYWSGVYRSADQGRTWINRGHGGRAFAVDPSTGTVYAGTDSVYSSGDQGAAWGAAEAGMHSTGTLAVAVATSRPATVYAGAITSLQRSIWRTTNGGSAWRDAGGGTIAYDSMPSVVISPTRRDTVYIVAAAWPAPTDGGWPPRSGTMRKTIDGGATWSTLADKLEIACLAAHPTDPHVLYAGGNNPTSGTYGVYKTLDGGATWTRMSTNLPSTFLPVSIAIDPSSPRTVYVTGRATNGRGGTLYKTTNGGDTWRARDSGVDTAPLAIQVDPANSKILFAGGDYDSQADLHEFYKNGPVYKSTDSANTWSPLSAAPVNGTITSVIVDPTEHTNMYLGTLYSGVWESTDAGQTWTAETAGLGGAQVWSLAITPDGSTLYAATSDGVYTSST